MRIKKKTIHDALLLILPTAIIATQWITIFRINLSWLLYILLIIRCLQKINIIMQNKKIVLFLVIAIIFPLITRPLGIAKSLNIELYFSIATGIVCMLYVYTLDKESFSIFIKGCGLACIIFALLGTLESFTGGYLFYSDDEYFAKHLNPIGNHYPMAAFGNTNDLSQFLTLLLPCCYYLFSKNKKVIIPYLVIFYFVVINTESKLSIIASLLLIMMTFLIYINITSVKRKHRSILYIVIAIMALLLIEGFTGSISSTISNILRVNVKSDFFAGRSTIYRNLLTLAHNQPLGGFGSAYAVQVLPPHNFLLYILCDYGWIATFYCIYLIVDIAKKIYKKISAVPRETRIFYLMIFVSILLFIITSSISSCNEQRKVIWLFIGICAKIAYDNKNNLAIKDN